MYKMQGTHRAGSRLGLETRGAEQEIRYLKWGTEYWILGPGYRKQVTGHKSQDQAGPLLTGRTLKHRSSSKEEINNWETPAGGH